MSVPNPSLETIKQGMRNTWMAGDFGVIAKANAPAGEKFVASLPLTGGMRVLDVACGTGNLSIPAAQLGCDVTGVDIAPNLLEQARARAASEGLSVQFDEGDAEALPYADGEFDAVITMFGAMFAPRPEIVASEMARVLKPGGLLAMGNWTPTGFTGKMFRVGAAHVPPPPGVLPADMWGEEAMVRERLSPYFDEVETRTVGMDFALPLTPAGAVGFFRQYFGPTQMAFARLDEAGKLRLEHDLIALWTGANVSEDPATVLVKNEFLKVTARKR